MLAALRPLVKVIKIVIQTRGDNKTRNNQLHLFRLAVDESVGNVQLRDERYPSEVNIFSKI